jgi:hypothetical protein
MMMEMSVMSRSPWLDGLVDARGLRWVSGWTLRVSSLADRTAVKRRFRRHSGWGSRSSGVDMLKVRRRRGDKHAWHARFNLNQRLQL